MLNTFEIVSNILTIRCEGHDRYERALLKYIYYHNWFTGRVGCREGDLTCPSDYFSHVLGVESQGAILVNNWNLKCEIVPNIFEIVSNSVK